MQCACPRRDEDNLEENEKIKLELNPQKINEPKTPYLSPMETDDDLDLDLARASMAPLSLHDGGAGPSAVVTARANGSGWSDSDRGNGGSPSPRLNGGLASGSSPRAAFSPRFSDDYYQYDSDDGGGEGLDPERSEKRRRFQEARKRHYAMRDVLRARCARGPAAGGGGQGGRGECGCQKSGALSYGLEPRPFPSNANAASKGELRRMRQAQSWGRQRGTPPTAAGMQTLRRASRRRWPTAAAPACG